MIIRIVKLTFDPVMVTEFKQVFQSVKDQIRTFEGCEHVELWNEPSSGNVFFTCSHWQSLAALDNYRKSELFRSTWAKTKQHFVAPPEAWSLNRAD